MWPTILRCWMWKREIINVLHICICPTVGCKQMNLLVSKESHWPILLHLRLTLETIWLYYLELTKMFLASVEWPCYSSAFPFPEMEPRLCFDMQKQAMEVLNVFFWATASAKEAVWDLEGRSMNMKEVQFIFLYKNLSFHLDKMKEYKRTLNKVAQQERLGN